MMDDKNRLAHESAIFEKPREGDIATFAPDEANLPPPDETLAHPDPSDDLDETSAGGLKDPAPTSGKPSP